MRSTERIVTTHVGSLPRPKSLLRLILARYAGEPVDDAELERELDAASEMLVARQLDAGIDVPSDGEISKVGFTQYVHDRFSGFGQVGEARLIVDDLEDFPGAIPAALGEPDSDQGHATAMFHCVGPVAVTDRQAVLDDIARFKRSLGDRPPALAFMGAPTPGQIAFNFPNAHYPSREDYLAALADALRYEYQAVIDAGFNLQLDSPDLAMAAHVRTEGVEPVDLAANSRPSLEALAYALRGFPPERLRVHICWGNYGGPHHRDVALSEIFAPIVALPAETFSFEAANPRHAHEWELFERFRLPEDKVLMPGLIDVTTNRIEHPRLIAQRILRFAGLVGRERVIASTDCGFSTVAGWEHVDPEVGWAKLASLAEGALMASEELWSR
jgi:5-methyltetrahydropteroyltriglutamate--homocysteine methyltransferase